MQNLDPLACLTHSLSRYVGTRSLALYGQKLARYVSLLDVWIPGYRLVITHTNIDCRSE